MFNRRLLIVCVPAVLYFAALLLRLFSMQVVQAEHWREEAAKLAKRTLRIPARRGAILDRTGEVLAEDRFELDLTVRLDRIGEEAWRCSGCGRPAFAAPGRTPRRCPDCSGRTFESAPPPDPGAIAPLLPPGAGSPPALFEAAREGYRRDVEAEVARRQKQYGRAERRDVERVLLRRERVILRNVPPGLVRELSLSPERYHGLDIRPAFRRVVAAEEEAGQLVGRIGPPDEAEGAALRARGIPWPEIWSLETGRSGLERGLEERLRCHEGRKEVERDARGRVVEVLGEEPPRDGETIRTSLSLPLQRTALVALREACREHGAAGGAFVALDPANGEVLVLASHGDPDHPDEKIYPWMNLAVQGAVPGSTFKILTALAGLEAGTLDPAATFLCDGPWHRIGCSGHDHGAVALREAISGSCNKYFAHAAEVMGIDVLAPFARKLGFGAPTGLPLPEEAEGLVPDPDWKRRRHPKDPVLHVGEVRQLGFGSGAVLVTPLQTARLMAVVANGGRLVTPSLVLGEGGAGERVVSEASAARIREAMVAVVTEGTGRRLGLAEFRAAGKTGTAELVAKQPIHMAWFAGFAPAEAPRVAFACYLRRVAAHGAEGAGPVVAAFLREFTGR